MNDATFIGIDCHPGSHTALAMNRFKEVEGHLTVENTTAGIKKFRQWLTSIEAQKETVIIGVEGGNTARHALLKSILLTNTLLFEVNPLYTKHRRGFGTKGDKTDLNDAKLIASVLTTELEDLPRIIPEQVSSGMLRLKKAVWYYDEVTVQGARLQNQLHKLRREHKLTQDPEEKQLLGTIVKSREKELDLLRKIKAEMAEKLKALLPDNAQNLTSIPGIGTVIAAKIVAHNGGDRFPNRDSYVKYTGIAPLARCSGSTNFFVKANRGNRKLNSVYYLAALCRILNDQTVRAMYEKKVASGKTKMEAIIYLMRKTAILVYSLLKSGQEYQQA